ncbi:MAG: hypothetical protein JNK64_27735 [Myxococcales bacterium]|nr:hypothetical protein [Myxococcales bacterium]
MRRLAALAALALAGCFDSVVGGECQPGWVAEGAACRPGDDAGDDAAPPAIDAPACGAGATWCGACVDMASDPDHCGACGAVCGSGLCSSGACVGTTAGHVVLIGHDYRAYHAAAARLLGNAAALGGALEVRVALAGGPAPDPATTAAVAQALTAGLAATGRSWRAVALGDALPRDRVVDVVVLLPRTTPAPDALAEGVAGRAALADFLAAGGTVIGLDGPGGTTVELMRGAALLTATAGAAATGHAIDVVAPNDALAVGVASPYLGELGTTTFAGVAPGDAVAMDGAGVVAVHVARP